MGRSNAAALQSTAGSGGAGPGPLEVEAAEVAGDVDYFANEKETGDFAGFHGFAGELVGIHATHSYFGFFETFGGGRREDPCVDFFFQGG